MYCKNCEISYNFHQEDHDCIAFLTKKVKELELSHSLSKFYDANIGIQCPNGHSLYPHQGKSNWQRNYGFIFCDTCKVSDLSVHKCFWRCMHLCDYDLCHDCMYKNIQPRTILTSQSSVMVGSPLRTASNHVSQAQNASGILLGGLHINSSFGE